MLWLIGEKIGQRVLYRRDDAELDELMDLAKLGREIRRCDAVANFPAGCMD